MYENSETSSWSPLFTQQLSLSPSRTSSSGLATVSRWNIVARTSVKIAMLAPRPRASVRTATLVNPGRWRRRRAARRKSSNRRAMNMLLGRMPGSGGCPTALRLEDRAAFHDETDALERADVFGRISFKRREIREETRLDHADLRFHSQHFRGNRRRALQRPRLRHPQGHHGVEFARVLAVRERPDIAAVDDRHASVHRSLERRPLARDGGRVEPSGWRPRSGARCHGRT